MSDNKSAHVAIDYDCKIGRTIPYYKHFSKEIFDLIKTVNPNPAKWLDTGCGTGSMIVEALDVFKETEFVLADPSESMLDIVKEKVQPLLINNKNITILEAVATQNIELQQESFDIITAVQCHHYLDLVMRKRTIENCFKLLKRKGIYVTFENIRPFSKNAINISLERWRNFQIEEGLKEQEAKKHIDRFDVEYFPINITKHLKLLKDAGFDTVELFWMSYMQAGFYAIKP